MKDKREGQLGHIENTDKEMRERVCSTLVLTGGIW